MFRPFSWCIGLRYTRAKRRNHFISFISLVSIIGIALGVTVLITVLSVMNGFDKELKDRILGMSPHVTISGTNGQLSDWAVVQEQLRKVPDIVSTQPYVEGQGLMTQGGYSHFVILQGILPQDMQDQLLGQKMVEGSLTDLKAGDFGIVLGSRLAKALHVTVGDKVTVVLPEAALTPAGVVPRVKRFTVTGLFTVGYDYDTSMAFMHLNDAQKLFDLSAGNVSGLQIRLNDLYEAPRVAMQLYQAYGGFYRTMDWTQRNGNFFEAVKLEKTMMFLMLMLIVAVAAFNILSTLVMVVTDKQSDIAILRTLGASPGMIMHIFMVQGTVIGVFGTLLGLAGGIALALNVTDLVTWIQATFQVQLFSADVYYISFLPSHLEWSDVLKISGLSFLMSFLATLYPARQASRVQPAEALRYE